MKHREHQPVRKTFDQIASRYDRCNQVLSLGLYSRWHAKLIRELIGNQTPDTLLDLCCGTGQASLPYLSHRKQSCEAFLIDFSEKMLQLAHAKASKNHLDHHRLHFIQADVEELPLPSQSIDMALMAYGARNLRNVDLVLQETYRVLKPGGRLGILELTRPKWFLIRHLYRLYLHFVVPLIGKWITKNESAYRYLSDSVDKFMSPDTLIEHLNQHGFISVRKRRLFFGVLCLIIAEKPNIT